MEEVKGKCFNCKNFDRYYTKGVIKFNRTRCGWCRKKVGVVKSAESCQNYEMRKQRTVSQYGVRLRLNDILSELNTIRSIIEDEKYENSGEEM